MDPEVDIDEDETLPVRVNILFDPDAAAEVSERLAAAGLQVEAEYGILGVVSGTAAHEAVDVFRSVEGVLAVETDRTDIEAIDTPESDPEPPVL